MLYLRMYGVSLPADKLSLTKELKSALGKTFQPLLRPMLDAPSAVLGADAEELRRKPRARAFDDLYGPTPATIDGEIFTDGTGFMVLDVTPHEPAQGDEVTSYRITAAAIVPAVDSELTATTLRVANDVFGVPLTSFTYKSERFEALKAEGRESPTEPSVTERTASVILKDRNVRTLALAIKAAGGLLVKDLPKQLPAEARSKIDEPIAALKIAEMIDSEVVVVCTKTQSQVTRAPNPEVVQELSDRGVKCACGRLLSAERMEEAVTITECGRALLDKARWLTVLLLTELDALGIPREAVLVEQTIGGDEIDCVANVSGELVLFELKDKEFNLGNAYSFGAKIGIIRPEHPAIITTEHVGNDAKEHFVRARLSGSSRRVSFNLSRSREEGREVTYIEGVENLRPGLENILGRIYHQDAVRMLNQVLPLTTLDGSALLRALTTKPQPKAVVAMKP